MLAVGEGEPVGSGVVPREDGEDLGELVEQPAEVVRIGAMIKQLLEEVRAAPLDGAGRERLKEIHRSSAAELEQGPAPEPAREPERPPLPFSQEERSEPELRIAQAQPVGWLKGLFHGMRTALVTRRTSARAQLEQMLRGALPAGGTGSDPAHGDDRYDEGTGQYL